MALPLSWLRVYTVLKRLQPPKFYSSDDNADILKELASIGVALGVVADLVEAFFSELFPDSAALALERWERAWRIPVRFGDSVLARQTRLIARIGRRAGYTLAQLADTLAADFGFADSAEVQFIEVLRDQIDAALIVTDAAPPFTAPAAPITRVMGVPQPGLVDDRGVRISLELNGGGGIQPKVTVLHHDGTSWVAFDGTAPGAPAWVNDVWFETRTTFKGKPANQPWTVTITDLNGTGVTYSSAQLLVSNDVDSAQIYGFYAQRDPAAVGTTPDMRSAQLVINKAGISGVVKRACERAVFIVDDPHSLCDREPMGA